MTSQKELLHGYTGSICPKIQLVTEKNKKQAEGWSPTWYGDDDLSIFGVTNGIETYCVDRKKEACSCKKWDLSGESSEIIHKGKKKLKISYRRGGEGAQNIRMRQFKSSISSTTTLRGEEINVDVGEVGGFVDTDLEKWLRIVKETVAGEKRLSFLTKNHGENLIKGQKQIKEKNLRPDSSEGITQAFEKFDHSVLIFILMEVGGSTTSTWYCISAITRRTKGVNLFR
ncbi:hypothetical protein KIW84_010599 [Lathyrus oleraceus]|uniref:Uncharacterized protein n=1 Tax=Pisum sativum TaxID=3888 RepID=A0A9D5BEA3_PEA|nr:hypothetical protein KIW84_010599 [Pisum sativum]